MSDLTSTPSIYQIKITLAHSTPEVWRRVLVRHNVTFEDLHYIIQICMGWTNSHAHQFMLGETIVAPTDLESDSDSEGQRNSMEEKDLPVGSQMSDIPFSFQYIYDFWDDWLHEVEIEKRVVEDPKMQYPACIDGSMQCPPDDCGGISGYSDMLMILADKSNPERQDLIDWLGGEFDASFFDLNDVNSELRNVDSWKNSADG